MRHLTANDARARARAIIVCWRPRDLAPNSLGIGLTTISSSREHACPITTKQGRTYRRAASRSVPLPGCLSRDAANPAFSPTGTACCRSAHRHSPANHRVRNSAPRPRRSTTATVASNVPSRTERIASNTCNTISTHEHARTRNNHLGHRMHPMTHTRAPSRRACILQHSLTSPAPRKLTYIRDEKPYSTNTAQYRTSPASLKKNTFP